MEKQNLNFKEKLLESVFFFFLFLILSSEDNKWFLIDIQGLKNKTNVIIFEKVNLKYHFFSGPNLHARGPQIYISRASGGPWAAVCRPLS